LGTHVLTDKQGLSTIRKQVRAELVQTEVDASSAFDCLVALTEACTQALAHIDGDDGPHPQISWDIDARRALFFIRDYSSRAWARASHPSSAPARDDDLDQRLESLGLQLMRGMMDDVRIEMKGTGTTIVLVKTFR
jgi:anti-sigma regulatory factor (Ser/Thr protein kinase)